MKLLLDPNHDITDLQGNLEVLEQKMEIIMELHRKLLDLMLVDEMPAEDVDAEASRADEILGKYNRLKAKVERNLNRDTLTGLSYSSHIESQRSYIGKQAAIEMKYEPVGSEKLIHALFRGVNSETSDHNP
ncbi:hypothetical protein JTB14_027808 [Gonioctena quinquepunctata]|nr:hypothetical protein JTB14_027808 [Gonioctena quinquepunctata]